MKKVLALTMALVMMLGLLAGCGQSQTEGSPEPTENDVEPTANGVENTAPADTEELEPVVLKWYVPFDEMEGSADVIEAFNAKLADLLPNTTVEFTFVGSYDPYGEQWPLLLAGEEEMDIAWSGWTTNLAQDVADGSVLALTDLINNYAPNLVNEMNTWADDFASVTKDGEVWAIPSIQPSVKESRCLRFDPSVVEYFDLEALAAELHSSHKTTEKVWDLLEQGVLAAADTGAITLGDNSWYFQAEVMIYFATRGYVSMDSTGMTGTLSHYYIDPASGSNEVIYLLEIPEVQAAVERAEKWANMGIFTQSQIAGQTQEGAKEIVGFNTEITSNWNGASEIGEGTANGSDGAEKVMLLSEKPGQNYVGTSSFGYASAQVIPFTSENPERAIMLLNLLHDEAGTPGNDLLNLLCYGFESTSEEAATYGWANYTAVENEGQYELDTSVRNGADSKHSMDNWVMGNTYKTMHDGVYLTSASNKAYAKNFWDNVYPNMPKCAISYMCPDSAGVSTELESISVVFNEYISRIWYGQEGGADLVAECLTKLETAGLSTVKADLNDQIAAYVG